jgi:hypothetical protein
MSTQPFRAQRMGRALDRLNDMLTSNLILSMHIRDDWIRDVGAHPPRLSIAFTSTGPTMTEAVRSMIQIELQEILQNPQAMVLLPSANPLPQPWNRVTEIPTTPETQSSDRVGGNNQQQTQRQAGSKATTAHNRPMNTAWQAIPRTPSMSPLVTQTYDISGIQDLPGTISRMMNTRMSELEENVRVNQAKQDANQEKQDVQFGQVFALLTTMSNAIQSLVGAAKVPPRDSNP